MNSDDTHNAKEPTPTPDGDKEATIDMAEKDSVRQKVGDKIREFLDGPTVVIWGSGATIPLGFPSMGKLLDEFSKVPEFSEMHDFQDRGFEEILSKLLAKKGSAEREVYEDRACQIIGELFHRVEQSNQTRFSCGSSEAKEYFQAMLALHSFLSAQPGIASTKSVDVLTTNYDCSWELLFNQNSIPYLDGFSEGRKDVDYSAFFPKDAESVTRLVKVHGSGNWFRYRTNDPTVEKVGVGELPSHDSACMVPKIIIPSNLKYEGVSTDMNFSNLMLTFGRLIKEAKSYLTIGFGFNDNHLTPLLKQEAKKGKPVVRLMKDMTRGGEVFAESLPNVLTISNGEERIMRNTCISWREGGKRESLTVFEDNLWSLPSFVKLLTDKQV